MRIGTPKEIKNREARIGLTPSGACELVQAGHQVTIESDAGAAIGFSDQDYRMVGCAIAKDAEEVFDAADLIIKVKEPQPVEIARLKPRHTLFTYLHLAPDPDQARGLAASGATCIAYETVTDRLGRLPLLTPMSEVAGRLSIQAGAQHLEIANGGSGVLLGGVTGVAPANVVVIGGGVAGFNAAQMAIGLGANVTVLDRSIDRLRELNGLFDGRATCLFSTATAVEHAVRSADLVVGAVLLPGAAAPKIVTRKHIASMRAGSVVVDIAIDQGGCFETSAPTSHDEPTFVIDGVVHYCVTNMPAAVARTSTEALANATLPFALQLANKGIDAALEANPHLAAGLNVRGGKIVHPEVIASLEQAGQT
ncbi:MAG: alanine dehydrogenase [Pseudomonadota bacterium]